MEHVKLIAQTPCIAGSKCCSSDTTEKKPREDHRVFSFKVSVRGLNIVYGQLDVNVKIHSPRTDRERGRIPRNVILDPVESGESQTNNVCMISPCTWKWFQHELAVEYSHDRLA